MNLNPLIENISRHIDLTEDEIKIIGQHVYTRRYLKGQFVLQQGDVCKVETFVVSGCLKVFNVDREGTEHIAMFGPENWWAGDLESLIHQTPADYSVQCLENTEVLHFPVEGREALFIKVPRLERFFRLILQNALIASQRRIIRNISFSAKERYQFFREDYPQIEQRVPQYMIASYLGITKEFLSKIRNQTSSS